MSSTIIIITPPPTKPKSGNLNQNKVSQYTLEGYDDAPDHEKLMAAAAQIENSQNTVADEKE